LLVFRKIASGTVAKLTTYGLLLKNTPLCGFFIFPLQKPAKGGIGVKNGLLLLPTSITKNRAMNKNSPLDSRDSQTKQALNQAAESAVFVPMEAINTWEHIKNTLETTRQTLQKVRNGMKAIENLRK
jgi:hypothetical protein